MMATKVQLLLPLFSFQLIFYLPSAELAHTRVQCCCSFMISFSIFHFMYDAERASKVHSVVRMKIYVWKQCEGAVKLFCDAIRLEDILATVDSVFPLSLLNCCIMSMLKHWIYGSSWVECSRKIVEIISRSHFWLRQILIFTTFIKSFEMSSFLNVIETLTEWISENSRIPKNRRILW